MRIGLGRGRAQKSFRPFESYSIHKKPKAKSASALLRVVQRFPRLVLFLHTMEHEHKVYREK